MVVVSAGETGINQLWCTSCRDHKGPPTAAVQDQL
jgi:hypothetical protein